MKTKILYLFIAMITLNSSVIFAQTAAQQAAAKQQYEMQKRTLEQSYETDIDALKRQANLSPAQRNTQRKAIHIRYEQQRRANQSAFEAAKRTWHVQNAAVKEERKDIKEGQKEERENEKGIKEGRENEERNEVKPMKPMKEAKPMKPAKPFKPAKPMKH